MAGLGGPDCAHFCLAFFRGICLSKAGAEGLVGLLAGTFSSSGRTSAATRCAAIEQYFFDMSK